MVDLTNLKAPGWSRVVDELSLGAPDDKAFCEKLLSIMSQVSAARQGVLFLPDRGSAEGDEIEARPSAVWPLGSGAPAGVLPAIEQEKDAREAARAAFNTGQSRVFSLERQDPYYDGSASSPVILAVPLPSGVPGAAGTGRASAVITLLVEPRSKDAVRSTLAMAEVLAGYLHGHGVRQALKKSQHASFSLDLATRLIAGVNSSPTFRGGAIQLCNDFAKHFGLDRVALGWVKADQTRVVAISDTEHFDRRMAMVRKVETAMDECLDQEQAILYPQPPADQDVLLSQAIAHAHRELAASDARLRVCSFPIRTDEGVIGVLTVETTSAPGDQAGTAGTLNLETVELVQSSLDLVAPVLKIRRSDDRALPVRIWDSAVKTGAWVVGPTHTVWKIVSVLAFAAIIITTLVSITYRVGAEAILQPVERRMVSAPLDGQLKKLSEGVVPGRVVKEGDILLELDSTEWQLNRNDALAKMSQADLQYGAMMREGDTGKAQQAEAQRNRAEAELRIYESRIERAVVRAPISGTIIGGDLRHRVGSTVKLGEGLMEIAPLDNILAVARVDERDISLLKVGGTGEIATKAYPERGFPFVVERVVPLATAEEGKNVFEVRARLTGAADWMRPGMEGRARFDTERHSLMWIGTRRIREAVRYWLWW